MRLRRILRRPWTAAAARVMGTLTGVRTQAPVAALTFDDGPDPQSTPKFVGLLREYGARATFFMVGEAARRYPEVVAEVVRGGHTIGSHSWDHPSFALASREERRAQLRSWEAALRPYGARLFRPPYGQLGLGARLDLMRAGYTVVGWSADVGDWRERDAAKMTAGLLEKIVPGCIVVLHDAIYRPLLAESLPDRTPLLQALEEALKRLAGRFSFVTVPELLRAGRPRWEYWDRRPTRAFMETYRLRTGARPPGRVPLPR
ncbi:MAG: polysaccharide deacetylase family protein [Armatimonadota bacterium]|nr:polysaccharide deacetylase family protein [Armatimonadota bacterium]